VSLRVLKNTFIAKTIVNSSHVERSWLSQKPRKSKNNEIGGACSTYGERRGVCRVVVGEPEGQRPLRRLRRRWDDNINIDLQEVGCGGMDGIGLAQNRGRWRALVNRVMNLRVP
jgi:hypothetical protein